MFSEKELKTTVTFVRKKKRAILNSENGSDFDYLKNLAILTKLENAAIKERSKSNAQNS